MHWLRSKSTSFIATFQQSARFLLPAELQQSWNCLLQRTAAAQAGNLYCISITPHAASSLPWAFGFCHHCWCLACHCSKRRQCWPKNSSASRLDGFISSRLFTSIKRLGAKWLTRESLDAAYICIVGFHSSLLFLLDLKLQAPSTTSPEASIQAVVLSLATRLFRN